MVVLQRKTIDDEEGVSEVVGAILTLAITVVLFSSVFAGVQNLSGPDREIHLSLEYDYEENSDAIYINLTHDGGENLEGSETAIYLSGTDGKTHSFSFSDDSSGGDLEDDQWSIGETLNLEIPSSESLYDDFEGMKTVEAIIIDDTTGKIIWKQNVKKEDVMEPLVRNTGVDYPLRWDKFAKPGDEVVLWADVIDLDTPDGSNITVEVSLEKLDGFTGEKTLETDSFRSYKENRYSKNITIATGQEDGTYLLELSVSDEINTNTNPIYIVLHIGPTSIVQEPWLRIREIKFEPESPTSGQSITTTATIFNDGGSSANARIEFHDQFPNGSEEEKRVRSANIPPGGGRDIDATWTIEESGLHWVTVNATTDKEGGIGDEQTENISVNPKILLVDDDGESDSEKNNDVSAMKDALDSSDFSFEMVSVGKGSDGPSYDDKLKNYDIVIWMTGSQTKDTLTSTDRENLKKLLNNDNRLWLIGEGIVNDAYPGWKPWLKKHLHTNIGSGKTDNAPQGKLKGYKGPLDSSDTFNITTEKSLKNGDYIDTANGGETMLNDTGNSEDIIGTSYNSPKRGDNRTVFLPCRFSAINESTTAGRSRLAYKVVLWLGNLSKKSGNDLAVSHQGIDPRYPDYREEVTVSATVRNNGPEDFESVDAYLEIDGDVKNETSFGINGGGEVKEVSFNWVPQEVGTYDVRIVVDPLNEIEETSEYNNDILYLGYNTTVQVQYNILVVDDTGGEDQDSFYKVRETYDNGLDYNHDDVSSPPTSDKMAQYNTVCWVTGRNNDLFDTSEREDITTYLKNNTGSILFIGDQIVSQGGSETKDFLKNILKIDPGSSGEESPSKLKGVEDDPITHGNEYFLDVDSSASPSHYSIKDAAEPIYKDEDGDVFAHRYHDEIDAYKAVVMGIDTLDFERPYPTEEEDWFDEYNLKDDPEAMRDQFIYTATRWFGKEDDRVELRVTDSDIHLSNKHPVLGRSYHIRAEIENIGGSGSNALVRFKDGDSHISTESLFVPAGGKISAEVKWQPLHAGPSRPLRVIVDPDKNAPEIPNDPQDESYVKDHMGFNNQDIKYNSVYYFWDDMENGTEKWSHRSNLAQINGENPIDYLGSEFKYVDTNVKGSWAPESSGVDKVNGTSHSSPNSYHMEETLGGAADVLLAITIDNSPSMLDRGYMQKQKEAAKTLVSKLSNDSAVTIFTYSGSGPDDRTEGPDFETLSGGGRQTIYNQIDNIGEGQMTPLWDTIGEAYTDIEDHKNDPDFKNLKPAIVSLTDGADYQSNDDSSINEKLLEKGSSEWCPWHKMQEPDREYDYHRGKYNVPYDDPKPGEWIETDIKGKDRERTGLLNSPTPIYSIGLGLEHHEPPNKPKKSSWIEGREDDYAVYTEGIESGTPEYNMWRIATTSGADYYYSPDDSKLEDIYADIAFKLTKPGNVTLLNEGKGLMNEDVHISQSIEENTNKSAVTPTLNLTDMETAWLTFWHQYYMLEGKNGGFLEVGYKDNSGVWKWNYTKPRVGPYTGNLNEKYSPPTDSSGTEIDWCWNGRSGEGTMEWSHVRLNLLDWLPDDKDLLDDVRVRFNYTQYSGGTGFGWWIDDVSIEGSRVGDLGDNIGNETRDAWQLNSSFGHSGNHSWWNANPNTGYLPDGVDNRLVTASIDLSRASTAELSAYFKFNINESAGRPPDGFRVEVSTDGGVGWEAINDGARTASGVSNDLVTADPNGWVAAKDVTRLNVDLSDFRGEIIKIRFRVVTNDVQGHYEDPNDTGGFFVDDVVVSGETV